jgi:hypothetical protein
VTATAESLLLLLLLLLLPSLPPLARCILCLAVALDFAIEGNKAEAACDV